MLVNKVLEDKIVKYYLRNNLVLVIVYIINGSLASCPGQNKREAPLPFCHGRRIKKIISISLNFFVLSASNVC
jgi:hypothetical protein